MTILIIIKKFFLSKKRGYFCLFFVFFSFAPLDEENVGKRFLRAFTSFT